MTPSIEVARKLAEVFAVTLDYLISDKEAPDTLKDRRMLARWQNLGETIAAAGTLNIDETGWKCKGNPLPLGVRLPFGGLLLGMHSNTKLHSKDN
jgi:transcriptional regulator with XRE-family HTH domain